MSEVEKHRVAIVVFCEAEGVDAGDARNVAAAAVCNLFVGNAEMKIMGSSGDSLFQRSVSVKNIDELDSAFRNGSFNINPGGKHFRKYED